eukprot:scaffold40933_cov49-Cyclotella_meneghiniana.AAC.2
MEGWAALIISLLKGGLDDMVIEASVTRDKASNFFTCTVSCARNCTCATFSTKNGASLDLHKGHFAK